MRFGKASIFIRHTIMDKWDELTAVFVESKEDTIAYLNHCNKENLYWIAEIFDDISAQLQSTEFIECIEQLGEKYPDLDLETDISFAKQMMAE